VASPPSGNFATSRLAVHLLYTPREEDLAILQENLDPALSLTAGPDLPPSCRVEILVTGQVTTDQLAACPHLRAIIIPWAGVPASWRDFIPADYPHLTIHNLHHNAAPVAELAMALLLAAAKFVLPFDRALRQNDWRPRYAPSPAGLLTGKTALILGYGAIGQRVARACHAFDMTVLATKRQVAVTADPYTAEIHPAGALASLLPRADALLICLPLTPETEGLIGARELALLPPGAVLVNIGRGAIVEQHALYAALSSGQLRAAGIDVWYQYPTVEEARANTPPANVPFHELDNIVMSPHRGGASDETGRLRMAALARLLNGAARGDLIPNQVDLQRGY